MKIKVLREKSVEELERLVVESRTHLEKSRFDIATGKIKNTKEFSNIRKDIARMLTLLTVKKNTANK